MTGNAPMFIKFGHKESGHVTYGDNTCDKILGEGVVGNPSIITIEGVLLVKGIKHNLLSVTQSCDKGYYIVFDTLSCIFQCKASKSLVCKGSMVDNIYMLDLYDVSMNGSKCLVTKN